MRKTVDKSVPLNISLPTSVYERLCKESDKLGLNRSAYISMALSQKWNQDQVTENLPALVEAFNKLSESVGKASASRRG